MVHSELPRRRCYCAVGLVLSAGCGVGGQRVQVAESRLDRIDQSLAVAKVERAEVTASVDATLAEVTTTLDARLGDFETTIHTETDGIPAWQMLIFLLGYFGLSKGWNGWRHRRNGRPRAPQSTVGDGGLAAVLAAPPTRPGAT